MNCGETAVYTFFFSEGDGYTKESEKKKNSKKERKKEIKKKQFEIK